jgi:F0F1-type ATP synthase membrane subunit b/b'
MRNYERTVEEARERLEQAREQAAKQTDEEMGKIEKEFTETLKNMHIDFEKDISADGMIQILKDLQHGTKVLSKLQENWAGMTLYFYSLPSTSCSTRTAHRLSLK